MEFIFSFKAVLLLLCFFLSAFFSGSEVALFSLDPKKIKSASGGQFTSSPIIQRYLLHLLEFPKRLLVTILIGNTLVNTAASIIAVSLSLEIIQTYKFPENLVLTIQIILLTLLLVLFGEVTPKIFASKNPELSAKIIAIPMFLAHAIIFPVSEIMTELLKLSTSKLSRGKKGSAISHNDFTHVARLGHEHGTLKGNEQELIESLVNYKNVLVNEIMIPRVDIIAVQSDAPLNQIISVIKTCGHSRIPVYKDDIDEIQGILYAKDLLPYFSQNSTKENFSLVKCMHKVIFVPETKIISELLHEFQEKNIHIAIAVDEYGGTAGLISLEDILEEIVGEIRYEYDKVEDKIKKMDDNTFILIGSTSLSDVNDYFNLNLSTDDLDFDTIGGYLFHQAGTIPKENFSINVENYKFTVLEIRKKRVLKIRVEKLV
ncbi:MAG: hemolysin family protein [Ignavibacteriaceae bacterium]|nr:hemolysin family protein [Ignavibacteriaceae bacterium]